MKLLNKKYDISEFSIKKYSKNKNKILIIYKTGGLGDILVQRMMFEDFKLLMPECNITFACKPKYFDAISDHPFIDNIIDYELIDINDYIIYYDTTRFCTDHERAVAPKSDKNRSDLWAYSCGLELTKHNMHLNIPEYFIKKGKDKFKNNNKKNVIIAPCSAMRTKNLLEKQLKPLVNYIINKGFNVYGLHEKPIEILTELNIETINDLTIKEWMGVIAAADYVVSVDTSTFHLAGGLGKPLMGIFTWADGKIYGKYYDFILVQKHRDNGNWPCGPCYDFTNCSISKEKLKPCLTEITTDMLIDGFDKMLERFDYGSANKITNN